MRVLMVHSFHHPRGGDATYTRSLTRLLEADGTQVVPFAMRHPDNEPSVWEHRFPSWVDFRGTGDPTARARAAMRMMWSAEAARACRQVIDVARPDVAHIQHVHRHLTPSILAPLRRAGVPIVWTVHDYELVCPSGHLFTQGAPCERCRGHRYFEAVRHRCKWDQRAASTAVAVEKSLHRLLGVWDRVDRFLCPSRYLADTLVRFGVDAARVQHLPNFLDTDRITPGEDPGEGWLYAGRLTEEKGVQVAIEAARRLPDVPLWICGAGPLEGQLRHQARDLPWVHFLGQLPRAELARRLQTVRVVIVPSLWPENFPYAVLEAQAANRAVVASRIGGIPEQIDDGVDGRLVPPDDVAALADAVRDLVTHPQRALAMGRAGRRRVRETLRPGHHLRTLNTVYSNLVGRGRGWHLTRGST